MAKVLVCDDDPLILELVDELLTGAGHTVTATSRSKDVPNLILDTQFDIALVDFEMPLMNGLDVLRHLRDAQPRCLRVLMSGKLDLPLLVDAVNRGELSRVIEKPFRASQVIEAIDDSLAARRRIEQVILGGTQQDDSQQIALLDEVLSGRHIQVALQPIVTVKGHATVAYECLMRSSHRELIHPMHILTAAEKASRVDHVAQAVADRALEWLEKITGDTKLFINLHPMELCRPQELMKRVEAMRPFAKRLVLEITERTYLLDIDSWSTSIKMLTDAGFEIAVDDLGSGYNSLVVLAELQPAFIKVDMSIVRHVDSDPRKQRLIELLGRFAGTTSSRLIAEGVETEGEAKCLLACGADLLQGYYFGKPSLTLPKA